MASYHSSKGLAQCYYCAYEKPQITITTKAYLIGRDRLQPSATGNR
jgi:hypothetical protein